MLRSLLLFALVASAGTAVTAAEIVRYRLPEWKRKHVHDSAKAVKIADTLTKLGCEVQKADHNGHVDLKYRCPTWRQLNLGSHDEAHKWEAWLNEFQFQTEHQH